MTTAQNNTTSTVRAYISDSARIQSAGAVVVSASDTTNLTSTIVAAALAGGVVGIAVGVTLADDVSNNVVSASISSSTVTATTGNISVTATSTPTIRTTDVVGAVSVSIGIAAAGGNANTKIRGTTEAFVHNSTLNAIGNNVLVHATATSDAQPDITGISGGLVAVTAMTSETVIEGTTSTRISGRTTVQAARFELHSTDTSTTNPDTLVVGVGGVTGAGAKSISTVSRTTEASVSDGANLTLNGATLDIVATSNSTADGKAGGAAGGGIAVAVLKVESKVTGITRASSVTMFSLTAGRLNVKADATSLAKVPSEVAGIGLLGGAGIDLDAVDTSRVEAYIGARNGSTSTTGSNVVITGGIVDVDAKSVSTTEPTLESPRSD